MSQKKSMGPPAGKGGSLHFHLKPALPARVKEWIYP